jgi:hypothetical protein
MESGKSCILSDQTNFNVSHCKGAVRNGLQFDKITIPIGEKRITLRQQYYINKHQSIQNNAEVNKKE